MASSVGAGRSDTGRRRTQNEDGFFVDDSLGLYVVSDGMGGHAAGEVASATAIAAVREVVEAARATVAGVRSGTEARDALSRLAGEAVLTANRRVHELATSDRGKAGMGCTVTLVLVAGDVAAMGHVGDSRLYLRRSGRTDKLSSDHTILAELVRSGVMELGEASKGHPLAHVLSRAVGTQPHVEVETLLFDLAGGEQLLLCSDGLSDYLDDLAPVDAALAAVDASESPPDAAHLDQVAATLVAFANESGGHDNITVVAVQVGADERATARASGLSQRFQALSSVFLFEGLSVPSASRILEAFSAVDHPPEAVVIEAGDDIDALLVVVKGDYRIEDPEGQVVGRFGPGSYLGLTALMRARPARATLRAETKGGTMLRLRGAGLRRLVRRSPHLGLAILDRLGRTLSADLERSYAQRSGEREAVAVSERF
ncbi:MAG: protein phosphatase 2C domain-containing protein [Myxococcota bacterium]